MCPKSLYKARPEVELTCSFLETLNTPKGTRPLTVRKGQEKRCLIVVRNIRLKIPSLLGIEPSYREGKGEKYERGM